jgi:GNAT superfamily N-acetyltransferase
MPAESLLIRPAELADLPAIVTMRDKLNRLELSGCKYAAIVPLSLDQFTAIWGSSFASPNHCWRVVEAQGRLVGFGLVYLLSPRTDPPGAYLHWAFVEEEYRRHGVGRRLLDELLTWAKQQGAGRVELQFIDGNVGAERFWTKMGFRPFARKCVYYLDERTDQSRLA